MRLRGRNVPLTCGDGLESFDRPALRLRVLTWFPGLEHVGVALGPLLSTPPDVPRRSSRTSFAVVIPAFNEVENIPVLLRELRTSMERHGLTGEVLLVDDGSTDGTGEAARREGANWKALRVLSHCRNRGKTEALLTAAAATTAEWLVLYDADLQHSPDEIPRFLARLDDGFDMVTGRKVGAYPKRLVSTVYNRLSQALFRVPVSDLNSMKAFRRDLLEEIHLRHDWHRFLVVLACARGCSVAEIDVTLHPRLHGTSKYQGSGRILVGVADMLAVALFLFCSRKPLLVFAFSGMLLALLGGVVGVVAIVLRVEGWMPPFGYRPLLYLVLLLETLGFLLLGFGMLAELVAQQRAELDALRRRLDRMEQTRSPPP